MRVSGISGLRELKVNIKLLNAEMQQKANQRGTLKAANVIKDEANVLAPVGDRAKTGRYPGEGPLAGSVKSKKARTGLKWETAYTVKPRKAFYWWFIEDGTSKQPAQPFLRPAFESKQTDAVKAYSGEVDKVIAKWM